jgi:hypothetical protein
MDYQIAIPSYQRTEVIKKGTLATLQNMQIDFDHVTVWVASDEQKEIYQQELGAGVRVMKALPGVTAARQFYHRFYPEGTKILNLDDDVYGIKQKDGNKLKPPTMPLEEIVDFGFRICQKTGAKIWGINPVTNAFFMKDEIRVGLSFICAIFYGSFAGDREMLGPRVLDPRRTSIEDFEMSIKSYVAHGANVRLDFLTPITKYFAKGGIDESLAELGIERKAEHLVQCQALEAAYPEYCAVRMKANDVPIVRLKNMPMTKIPLGNF